MLGLIYWQSRLASWNLEAKRVQDLTTDFTIRPGELTSVGLVLFLFGRPPNLRPVVHLADPVQQSDTAAEDTGSFVLLHGKSQNNKKRNNQCDHVFDYFIVWFHVST